MNLESYDKPGREFIFLLSRGVNDDSLLEDLSTKVEMLWITSG